MTVLEAIADRIIVREGGIADVGDGAGLTSFGQTSAWLAQYGLTAPTSAAEARANYLQVWALTKLSGIAAADDLLADVVLDFAVNAGERVSIRTLQIVLSLTADGAWGPQTQAAVDAADRRRLAAKVLAEQVAHYGAVITKNPARAKFAHGWMNRKAEQIARL